MCRKGVADEQLAKLAEERSRKRYRNNSTDAGNNPKAIRRSASTTSSASVSTISTNHSRSPSPSQSKRSLRNERPRSVDRFDNQTSKSVRVDRRARSGSFSSSDYSSSGSADRAERRPTRREAPRRENVSDNPRVDEKETGPTRRIRSPTRDWRRGKLSSQASAPHARSPSPYSKRIALTQAMNR